MVVIISCLVIIFDLFIIVYISRINVKYGTNELIIAIATQIFCIILNYFALVCTGLEMKDKLMHFSLLAYFMFDPFMYLFVYEFFYVKKINKKKLCLIFAIPLVTTIFSIVPCFYKYMFHYEYQSITETHIVKGIWYYVTAYYCYALDALAIYTFYRIYKNTHLRIKNRVWTLVLVAALILLFNFLSTQGVIHTKIDVTPLLVSGIYLPIYYIIKSMTFNTLKNPVVESIASEINNLILTEDRNGVLTYANDKLVNLFEINRSSLLGLNFENREEICKILPESFYEHGLNIEQNEIFGWGKKKYKGKKINMFSGDKTIGVLYNFYDMTDEVEYTEKLVKIGRTDILTKLKNRYAFENDIKKFDENNHKEICVVILDLDNLKVTK